MSLLVAKDLHKTYTTEAEPLEVLKGVQFQLDPGERVAVLGASGAGKSTLLHCLGALDPPSQGEVFFEGQSVYKFSERRLAQFRNQTLGFVFQFHHLLPMLSALENVALPRMISGQTAAQAQEEASGLLGLVGLGERLDHRPDQLSGGEQQRVAIARALVTRPRVVLADEPTGNLDSRTGEGVMDLLLKLQGEIGGALVVVTHNEGVAEKMDRKIRLKDGKVLE